MGWNQFLQSLFPAFFVETYLAYHANLMAFAENRLVYPDVSDRLSVKLNTGTGALKAQRAISNIFRVIDVANIVELAKTVIRGSSSNSRSK
jgi:hypothetical protein